jgi:predicted enzyme related to lactoylglutathione lyase
MDKSTNILNWFEISVDDIGRAKKFYETIFLITMDQVEMKGMQVAFFPAENGSGKVSGALVQGPIHNPSADGAKIYFNGEPDLDEILSKVAAAGGRILMSKELVTKDIGYIAFLIDTEGNTVALHSSS